MPELGKALIGFGLLAVVAGVIVLLAGKFGLHRLPGDIFVRRGNFTFAFPIVTCIVLSILLTIVANLIFRQR
jgi:hypothetical protein